VGEGVGRGSGMPIMKRKSSIRPAAASSVYSIKKGNDMFLSRIHPKYSVFTVTLYKKDAYMTDLRKLYILKKLIL
jgi:hypothetical protein